MCCVTVRNVKIGEGIPKICVPIVGRSLQEILEQAKEIAKLPADLVEWRCDWYGQADSREHVQEALRLLREVLEDRPLLFTFRTADEGGKCAISTEGYIALNQWATDSGCVDLMDVELFLGEEIMGNLTAYAHRHGVKVVASNHDFVKTPPMTELIQRMKKMQELGADIAKVAVMPQKEADVQELLHATEEMARQYATIPLVTMSMTELGMRSRIEGELHGSAITFASAGHASAPGQIPIRELAEKLRTIHLRK